MGKKDYLPEEIKVSSSKKSLFLNKIANLSASTYPEQGLLFSEIVKTVGALVDTKMVSISEIRGKELYYSHLYLDGVVTQNAGHCPLDATPCATVKEEKKVLCYSDVQKKFPDAEMLKKCNAYSYCGIPCLDSNKNVIAVLCIVDDRKRGFDNDDIDLIKVLSNRIGMESECKRHLAKQALVEIDIREREKKYRTLVQTANDAIFTADIKVGLILEANRKASELTGWSVSELVGKYFTEMHPKDERERYEHIFKEAVQRGSIIASDLCLLHRNGKKIPVEVSANVFELNGNEVIQGIFRDLSARKKAEENSLRQKTFMAAVLNHIEDGIAACDEKGTLSLFNKATRRFHGIKEEKLPPEEWAEHYDLYLADGEIPMRKEDIPLFRAFKGEEVTGEEMVISPKEGNPRSLIASGCAMYGPDGKKIGAVVSMHDITERKKAEDEIRAYQDHLEELVEERTAELSNMNARLKGEVEARKRFETELAAREQSYRTLANNIPGIVFRLNVKENYKMNFFNDMVKELTGFDGDELKGYRCNAVHSLIILDDRSAVAETIKKALDDKEPYEVEYRIRCKRNEIRSLVERGRPVFDGDKVCFIDGIILENTRQKQVEEELRMSEARLMDAQKTGKLGSWEWDIDRDIVCRSPENYRIFGFKPDESENITYADFVSRIHSDDRGRVEQAIEKCKQRKKHFNVEYRIILPDGEERTIHSHAKLIRSQKDDRTILSGVVQDITEIKKFEVELKTFKAAVDNSEDCTFLIDPEKMRFVDFNKRAIRKLGYSKGDLLSMGPQDINIAHSRDEIKKLYDSFRQERSFSKKIETLYRKKSGKTFPVEINLSKLRVSDDKFIILSDARDISERVVAGAALKESEERYRLFAENFQGIAFQGQLGGAMLFLHGDIKLITGYEARDLFAGKPRWDQMYHPEDKEAFYDGFKGLRSVPNFSVEREYRIITKGGDVKWVEEMVCNICDDDGKPVKVQGVIFDITEKKKVEKSLQKATKVAEEANCAKSRFMANINHEIRSPMQAVIGMTEMLKETEMDEEQADYIDTISTASDNVLRLVNNVLDFSKIESGGFELEEIDFDLSQVVKQSMNMVSFQARKKGLKLDCKMDDFSSNLKGDPVRLQQVLNNLLVNAVKFTKEGNVTLKVIKKGGTRKTIDLELSVTDTGIGVSPEKLPFIFESYVQSDKSISRLFGGTGLGTTISKQLVEMMGGRIWAKSREGKGSTFTCAISFKKGSATKKAENKRVVDITGAVASRALNILLVEDSIDIQMLVRLFFEKTTVHLVVEENGVSGVEAFKSNSYDMVLMDIEMPLMNGFSACEEIRKWEKAKRRQPVPIIALTGNSYDDNFAECKKIGFDAHLLKPMKRDELFSIIDKYAK